MKNINIFMFCAMASLCCSAHAQTLEPLEASSGAYTEAAIDRFLAKNDKDRNGKFEKSEDAQQWKRNRKLDKNRDGALDREELRGALKYVNSPGQQLRNVCFKRVGTRRVYLDFYFPDVDESKKKPVVIYTHGGGWAAGSKHGAGNASFNVVHRALLKQGFCVVSVGYRLVARKGETAMRDCVVDAKDALRFISAYRKELGIDPNRIFTFGDSAGGHLAQMLLLSPSESLQGDPALAKHSYKTVAGVSWYGPCDFEDEQLFNHNDRKNFRDRFGPRILGKDSNPEDKLKLYREMSPINYLTKNSPPLLMIQGDKDTTIPVKHAYHMQKKAEELRAAVEILIVKNAGHNWRNVDADIAPTRDEIVKQTIQFFVDSESSMTGRTGQAATEAKTDSNTNHDTAVTRPQFSWDQVPLYMHVRKATAFTPEELDYLAGFPLITLEKTTGRKTYGSTEDGSLEAAKAIKAINKDARVLYYRNVMCNYSTYAVNADLKDIPGAFVQGKDGNKNLHQGKREIYDLSNPDLRKWWVDHCVEMAGHDEIDGIFLDGNIKALEPGYLRRDIGKDRKQEVAEGYELMMKDLKDRIPANKMLLANMIRARLTDSGLSYMEYFDGSYLEGIETPAGGLSRVEYLAKGIDAIQQAARRGKIICMSIGLGEAALTGLKIDDSRKKLATGANVQPRLEYCLALFLVCAEEHSYFLPHDGYSVNKKDSSVWLKRFPEYDKPLGPPAGPAVQDGYTYTREFESARVFLDIEKEEATITWK